MSNVKGFVLKGFFWSGIQLVVNQGFAFAIKILLAKLLFPAQFGVVGMATVFTGFVQIFSDIGIGAALIQRKSENLREEHFHTSFWTGVAWSTTLYLIISFGVGPLAAIFYHEPILKQLIPVLSLGILSSPVNLVHKAQLTKQMDFKKIAIIDNISNIVAGTLSILLAYLGFGVWSLAFNTVASIVIAMPLYFRATRWIPKFIWEQEAFRDVFGFGVFTTGVNVVNYWMQNLDYLLIGKFINPTTLGFYTLAFLLTDTFRMKLMSVINNVMYPIFSKKQDDIPGLVQLYKKTIFYNCAISFPIMMFFVVCGGTFLVSFFGVKWSQAEFPLQILAISVMFHMLTSGNNAIIRAMGKPKLEFRLQIIKAVIYIPMLVLGIYYYGVNGAALVVLINKILSVFFAQNALNQVLDLNLNKEMFKEVGALILAAIVSGLVAFGGVILNIHYLVCGTALLLTYLLVIALLRKDKLNEVKSIILKK